MEFGLGLPQIGPLAAVENVHTVAKAAEEAGFSSLWALDRLLAPLAPRNPYPASPDGLLPEVMRISLDPVVTLATAAAVTEKIRIGTNVLVAPWYSPVMLARTAASLDVLSRGRFTLGLGLGWSADEFAAVGVEQRGMQHRMEEILEVMARVWRDDVVEIETTHEVIAPSTIGLKPQAGRVPILLAAYTPAGLERIARRADGWSPAGVPTEYLPSMWGTVLETAERYGRNPQSLRLVVRANIKIEHEALGSDRPVFVGSLDQVRDDIERTREVGAHELLLELQGTTTSAAELLDVAATLTEGALVGAR